jgi:hypothetical protein
MAVTSAGSKVYVANESDNTVSVIDTATNTVVVRPSADCSSGLAPDLCSRGVRPLRTLSEGTGGFLPGVPLDCLDTRDRHVHQLTRFVELTDPTRESNAGRRALSTTCLKPRKT